VSEFTPGQDAFAEWRQAVENGVTPEIIKHQFDQPLLIPGHVCLLGGAPGAGKTAFVMQVVIEALRFNPDRRVLVANCEMSDHALLDRQLSRLSGVPAEVVRRRQFTPSQRDRVAAGVATLGSVVGRLAFLRKPYTIANVASSAAEHGADIVVIDYIQRFSSSPGGDSDSKQKIAKVMDDLRAIAALGFVVIVLSAVGRTRDDKGRSSYASEGLNLASFRESSELEFGADDAFILAPVAANKPQVIVLKHLKCRHGKPTDLHLKFERDYQGFSVRQARDDGDSWGVEAA
jgi:replicative DNA helicase